MPITHSLAQTKKVTDNHSILVSHLAINIRDCSSVFPSTYSQRIFRRKGFKCFIKNVSAVAIKIIKYFFQVASNMTVVFI